MERQQGLTLSAVAVAGAVNTADRQQEAPRHIRRLEPNSSYVQTHLVDGWRVDTVFETTGWAWSVQAVMHPSLDADRCRP